MFLFAQEIVGIEMLYSLETSRFYKHLDLKIFAIDRTNWGTCNNHECAFSAFFLPPSDFGVATVLAAKNDWKQKNKNKLWSHIGGMKTFSKKNLPKKATQFVQQKNDTIRVFRFEPLGNKISNKESVAALFKDTIIWAILDTNVTHIQPFRFGLVSIFSAPNDPNFNLLNILNIDSTLVQSPQKIRFLGEKSVRIPPYTMPQPVLNFNISPVLNPKLVSKRCWEQQISIHKTDFYLVHTQIDACDCGTGTLLAANVQTIKLEQIFLREKK